MNVTNHHVQTIYEMAFYNLNIPFMPWARMANGDNGYTNYLKWIKAIKAKIWLENWVVPTHISTEYGAVLREDKSNFHTYTELGWTCLHNQREVNINYNTPLVKWRWLLTFRGVTQRHMHKFKKWIVSALTRYETHISVYTSFPVVEKAQSLMKWWFLFRIFGCELRVEFGLHESVL